MTTLSRIALTMGDAAGIGPEVICKAIIPMSAAEREATCVIGDPVFMRRAAELVGADFAFVAEGAVPPGAIRLIAIAAPDRDAIPPGQLSAAAGELGARCVKTAVEMALAGEIDVIVTASLNKTALRMAGYKENGHAGLLATYTGAKRSYAVLAGPKLTVIHVTTHVALRNAPDLCTQERILETIHAAEAHARSTGIARPRIAVAAINPHSGEGGLYGNEDAEQTLPAVEAARAEGMDVTGPVPGDVVFNQAVDGRYDIVVAQFHDQGHVPAKLIGGHETVNVTAGLPVLRTSVDHGTAFDIAWKGVADPRNMMAAIAMARGMRPVR